MFNYHEEFYDGEIHRAHVSLLSTSLPYPGEVLKLLEDLKQEIYSLTSDVPMRSGLRHTLSTSNPSNYHALDVSDLLSKSMQL